MNGRNMTREEVNDIITLIDIGARAIITNKKLDESSAILSRASYLIQIISNIKIENTDMTELTKSTPVESIPVESIPVESNSPEVKKVVKRKN